MTNPVDASDTGRRRAVLESALDTFARYGYRRTSMDAVARAARISRPGLYFLFTSKQALFREAASHVLMQDLAAIGHILADDARPLSERLLDAFDRWAGRYIGPMANDVPAVLAEYPDLLDDDAREAPARFEAMVTAAIGRAGTDITQTLISVSIGLKHQVDSRDAYRTRLQTAIRLVIQ